MILFDNLDHRYLYLEAIPLIQFGFFNLPLQIPCARLLLNTNTVLRAMAAAVAMMASMRRAVDGATFETAWSTFI